MVKYMDQIHSIWYDMTNLISDYTLTQLHITTKMCMKIFLKII